MQRARNIAVIQTAAAINTVLLLTGCRSTPRERRSSIDISVMSAVHLHWDYHSVPIDTTVIHLPNKL